MKEREFHLHDGKTGAAITVRVTPRSSRNEISEILSDGTIKIRLTAPPNEEQTNQALIDLLAKVLSVNPVQIEIIAGATGNDKLLTITDLDKGEVQERILQNIA
jgi:uncharacterized protein (TIGR00251 family)